MAMCGLIGNRHNRIAISKQLLCERSEIFTRMLTLQTESAASNQIHLTHNQLTVSVVSQFVTFLYTGKFMYALTKFDSVVQLLELAHQFQVYELVSRCAAQLAALQNIRNCLQCITVAGTLGLNQLHCHTVKYISYNYHVFLNTYSSDTINEASPSLCYENLQNLVEFKWGT